jgi:uncharacterized protein (DUF1778 family)
MTKKETINIRLEADEKAALEAAAAIEDRAISAYVRRVMLDYLRREGFLKPVAKPRKKA